MNKFSDLTAAEFRAYYLGYKGTVNANVEHTEVKNASAIDWTTKGDV